MMKKRVIITIFIILIILGAYYIQKSIDRKKHPILFEDVCNDSDNCIEDYKNVCVNTEGMVKNYCGADSAPLDVCNPYGIYCDCGDNKHWFGYDKGCVSR